MKLTKRLTIMEKTFRDRGEVSYIISPNEEVFSSPFIPAKESPEILEEFKLVRQETVKICENLQPEDFVLHVVGQAASTKWHLAHTTWLFESYILKPHLRNYTEFNPAFHKLFCFCCEVINEPGVNRWHLSRPSIDDIFAYRTYVDAAIEDLLYNYIEDEDRQLIYQLMRKGLHHEVAVQEKILTDIKYNFSLNPLQPAYEKQEPSFKVDSTPLPMMQWVEYPDGLYNIGFGDQGFAHDHEKPRHTVYLHAFSLAKRLVTNYEYMEFIEDGGYRKKELWLSDGWKLLQNSGQKAPLYWKKNAGKWHQFTLRGPQPLIGNEPVSHVTYYEASAYARWADARLPTEFEWEMATTSLQENKGEFYQSHILQPTPIQSYHPINASEHPLQLLGNVWEWTGSAFLPYPGFRQDDSSPGDYHSKFMSNQMVLRGGSCLTSSRYFRMTYRHFLYPSSSLYCSGIRLAKEV